MELSPSRLKTFLYFLKKKFFLYFGKWSFLVLRFKNFRRELSELKKKKKKKKKNSEKVLIFREIKPSCPKLKKFLIFQKRTCKAWKTKISYISLKKFS